MVTLANIRKGEAETKGSIVLLFWLCRTVSYYLREMQI